jgi:phosphoadenosine phosphosulfate reductase
VSRVDKSIFETYAGLEGRQLLEPILRDFAGRAAVVSSFGAESAVLLHMVAEVDKATPVIFLDTGKHFWETLSYRSMLIDRLGLTGVRIITPGEADLAARDADGTLHTRNTDQCCHIRKTLPLAKALEGLDVTISGRKRYHGAARATLDFLSISDSRLKVEPLAGFSALDINAYMKAHDLPSHPLTGIGYYSIGCEPCTMPGGSSQDPRAGRWAGTSKTECGIHWTHNGESLTLPSRASH